MARIPRTVMFLPGPALTGYGWSQASQPLHYEGLAVAAVLGVACWPLVILAVVFGVPAVLMACWPRPWRRRWRNRNPGWFIAFLHWAAGSPVGRAGAKSAYIPKWMDRAVKAADRYGCVVCGSDVAIQLDHVGPWSLGFLTTLWNLMTLCRTCNGIKSNAWMYRGRFWPGQSRDPIRARKILEIERLHRYNPARWYRAAWELTA
jgi:hypothetical protein